MREEIERALRENYEEFRDSATEYVSRILCRKPIEGGDMVSRAVFSNIEVLKDEVEVQLLARFRLPNGMLKDWRKRK